MVQHIQTLRILGLSLLVAAACDSGGSDETTSGNTTSDTDAPTTTTTTTNPTTTENPSTTENPTTTTDDPTTSGPDPDSSTGDDTTSGDTESGSTTGGGEEVRVGNTPEVCMIEDWIFPILPEEEGHFAATTLTPESYPFDISRVVYGVRESKGCDATLAHRVDLFVTDGGTPPDMPSAEGSYSSYDIPAEPGAMNLREVEVVPDMPITLMDGESLVISLQMVGNNDLSASLCIDSCQDTGGTAGLDFWSNAADEPYAWADMVADFAFASNFTARMYGFEH